MEKSNSRRHWTYEVNMGHRSPQATSPQRSSVSREVAPTNNNQSRREKLFSLDPTLADWNYKSYEQEIMEYKEQRNYDFKTIVSNPPRDLQFQKLTPCQFYESEKLSPLIKSSPSVQVLKAAPNFTDNNNNELLSTSEFHSNEPKCQMPYVSNHSHPGFSEQLDGGEEGHNDDIRYWIDELSRLFKIDMEMVERSNEFDSVEKLREYNTLCSLWIKSIYEQNQVLIDALDEIKDTAKKDTQEFDLTVLSLKTKLRECHSERSQWKAKAEGLEYETLRHNELIKKLTVDMNQVKGDKLEKETNFKQVVKDLEALKVLIIRLRDGGVWDLDGLDMSTETFTKILGAGWKHLYGMKMEGFDEMKKEKTELKEELASMRHEREHLRAKLFSKEKNLHKLKGEEMSVKARVAFSKAEEGALRNRIEDLKSEERALKEMGQLDTRNEFRKL